LDWNHNTYYHRLLLSLLPQRCHRVLDVGCGAGLFATRLAGRVEQVDAVDRLAAMIEVARQCTPDNVNCILADVLTDPLPGGAYDAIFSISALHHMPLADALLRFAALLRPGGVVAAIALPRMELVRELPAEIVAAVGHPSLGAAFVAARSVGSSGWFAKDRTRASMPVVIDPQLTTRQVAQQAGAVLPGVLVRRLVFWRYLLRRDKPPE
jgi:SAM-dependent methyltransferase